MLKYLVEVEKCLHFILKCINKFNGLMDDKWICYKASIVKFDGRVKV